MKILSLERSLRDSTTSHSLWYFDKYFDGIDEIFANQLAKNTKRFKLEFSRPSHSVQLQKDKSCYQASQKLGKIHGIFEVQTCLESCPTFGKFRRCHHHLTVWLELFSKLTRTAVNHSFGARHSHPKRAKEEVQQEGRNPHGDQVNCGEICADLQMVYHLQWTPSLGRMQDKVWRDGAQTDLETPVSALFASPQSMSFLRQVRLKWRKSHYAEGLPAPFAPQTSRQTSGQIPKYLLIGDSKRYCKGRKDGLCNKGCCHQ